MSRFNQLLSDFSTNVSIISIILSTSVFIYLTIYRNYVPTVEHTRPVHFQFDSRCSNNCTNPVAIIKFSGARSTLHLARGQSYKFTLVLEMPESDINWNQGMFMVRLRLVESQGKTICDVSRSAILKYKSSLTKKISALFYWPLAVTNYRNEMQTLNVQLVDDFIEGAQFHFRDIDMAVIELLARDVQVYSAQLRFMVNLVGLSYYMYSWPITSAVIAITTLASFMGILSIYRTY